MTHHRSRTLSRLLVGGLCLGLAGAASAQPANDDCANATPVSIGDVVNGTTSQSVNSGDITTCTSGDTRDVWYRLDVTESTGVTVSTCPGASYDTSLSAFNSCGGAQIACNDDTCSLRSQIQFSAAAGNSYYIRVSGYAGETGTFTMSIVGTEPPPDPSVGPDCLYTECVGVTNWGSVGGIRGYSLASHTCNIGDTPMFWGFSHDESPVLAMNAYRYSSSGEFRQIGMSWCKTACCAADGSGCGQFCDPDASDVLGPGCRDIYSASYNGGQSRLAPRSTINPWTGDVTPAPGGGGNAIFKRLQVAESDLQDAGGTYFVEGVYVASDDAPVGNHYNNASYKQVTVGGGFTLNPVGAMNVGLPAIYAWQDLDAEVDIVEVDVPGEGRYFVGSKATAIRGGYRYEYAVYNLNSDLGAGSLSVTVGEQTSVGNIGFHDVDYHSGEAYDNTDWNGTKDGADVTWQTTIPYAVSPNGNAVRWGTMYSFWFDSPNAPAAGGVDASLGLFAPHVPNSVSVTVTGPEPGAAVTCAADWNMDGFLNDTDFFDWVNDFFSASGPQGQSDFNEDTFENAQDWFDFVNAFFAPEPGCEP